MISPCSSVLPFALLQQKASHTLQALFLRMIRSLKKEPVSLVFQSLAFSKLRKVFTYITFFHEYMTENRGVAFFLITRFLHNAMALTK